MFICFICKKIILKNSVIYMCLDNSFCSNGCRQIIFDQINNREKH